METPTPKKRRRLLPILAGLVVACVVLVFIAALLSPTEQPAATVADQPLVEAAPATTVADQPTATPQPVATDTPVLPTATPEPPTATPQPTATPSLEDQILAAIGRVNRNAAPAPYILIDEQVVVDFAGNDGLSNGMIRRDSQRRTMAVAQAVRDNTGNQHDIAITVTFPLIDAFGNTSEQPVMRVRLTRATLEKINFDGFLIDNLPGIADYYWQHPAISK